MLAHSAGGLPGFRPWMANLHLVQPDFNAWQESVTAADAEATAAFIEATDARKPVTNPAYFTPGWKSIDSAFMDRLKLISDAYPAIHLWSRLAAERPMRLTEMLAGLRTTDADTRWLTLEAYLYHGTNINEPAIDQLLAEEDEYARVSAQDVLLHYEDAISPYLVAINEQL